MKKILLSIFMVFAIFTSFAYADEDFTTYTEVDATSRLTVTSSTVTFTALQRVEVARVYKNFGIGYFDDFTMEFDFIITADTGSPATVLMAGVSNTTAALGTANPKLNFVVFNSGSNLSMGTSNATANSNLVTPLTNTRYYVTMIKLGTSLTSSIYDNIAKITPTFTTTQVVSSSDTYRYGFPISARNATGTVSITGDFSNLLITLPTPPELFDQDFEVDKDNVLDVDGDPTAWSRTAPGLNSTGNKLSTAFVNTDLATQAGSAVFPIGKADNSAGSVGISFYIKSHTTIASRGMTFYTGPTEIFSSGTANTTFKLDASQIQGWNGASYDNLASLSADTEYFFEIDADVTAQTYSVSIDSTPVITDAAFLQTSDFNYLGVFEQNGGTGGAPVTESAIIDEYIATLDTITITSPTADSTYQRNRTTNTRDVTVNVSYSGTVTNIEARFDGGSWVTLVTAPSSSPTSGVLTCAPGDGAIEVRFSNSTSVTDSIADIWVGEYIITAISQSNMAGHGDNDQTYSGTSSEMWQVGDSAWSTTADPSHENRPSGGGGGSVIPLLANLYDTLSIPTKFITTAVDGTALVTTPFEWAQGGTAYDEAVTTIMAAISVETETIPVICYQGEADSKGGVLQGEWATAFSLATDDLKTDTGLNFNMYVTQLSSLDAVTVALVDLNLIRKDQADVWDSDSDVFPGPVTHDIDTSASGGDGTHISTDAGLQVLAERFFHFLFGGDRGPVFLSAIKTDTDEVTVSFTVGTAPLQSTRIADWVVTDDTGTLTINSAVIQNNTEVLLTFSRVLDTNPLVSFGYGNDGAGTIFRDSATVPGFVPANTGLPAEPFVEEVVIIITDDPGMLLFLLRSG